MSSFNWQLSVSVSEFFIDHVLLTKFLCRDKFISQGLFSNMQRTYDSIKTKCGFNYCLVFENKKVNMTFFNLIRMCQNFKPKSVQKQSTSQGNLTRQHENC